MRALGPFTISLLVLEYSLPLREVGVVRARCAMLGARAIVVYARTGPVLAGVLLFGKSLVVAVLDSVVSK